MACNTFPYKISNFTCVSQMLPSFPRRPCHTIHCCNICNAKCFTTVKTFEKKNVTQTNDS